MALTTSIVSYYKFDANNSNDAVGSNNGTDTSMSYGASYGKINDGANFNGSAYITCGTTGVPTGDNPVTLSGWFYLTSGPSSGNRVVLMGDGSPSGTNKANIGACVWNNSGTYHLGIWSNYNDYTSSLAVTLNTWHYFALTYSGSGAGYLYLDSSSQSFSISAINITSAKVVIGATADPTPGYPITGYMDEIGLWSRALSSSEISQLYNSGAGLQYPFTLPSVSDSTAVSDSPILEIISYVNASDSSAVSDSPTLSKTSYLSVSDSSAVSDTPVLSFTSYLSVSDSSAVSDTPTVFITILFLSVSNSSTVSDSPLLSGQDQISVIDSSAVSDTPTLRATSYINVADSSVVSDTPTIISVSLVSASDSSAVSDTPTLEVVFYLSVSDSSAVSDTPNITIPASTTLTFSVTDSTAVSDTPQVDIALDVDVRFDYVQGVKIIG
jgi:hypothetical protein